MAEGIRSIHRQYLNSTLPSIVDPNIDEPSHHIQPFDITQRALNNTNQFDKLVLINFSPNTDRSGSRKKLWKKICENESNPFTICFQKPEV